MECDNHVLIVRRKNKPVQSAAPMTIFRVGLVERIAGRVATRSPFQTEATMAPFGLFIGSNNKPLGYDL